jgi:hypothetical protein
MTRADAKRAEGLANFRDLGGLPAADGVQETRHGCLSGVPSELMEAGRNALLAAKAPV